MKQGVDVVHYHALGPGLVAPLPRFLSRAGVVQTVHGLDQDRAKWGRVASGVLATGCWMSARVPDATVVVSRALQEHYRDKYRKQTFYIPNGVETRGEFPIDAIGESYGLEAGSYLLFVGRLVPEKAPDLLLRAFRKLDTKLRLVIAGGSSFTDEYVRSLEALAAADPRVILTGYVHGKELDELYANAAAFVLPSDVEGMPLTMLEAAAHGAPIVASNIAPHLEVLGSEAPGRRLFAQGDEADLIRALETVSADPVAERYGASQTQARMHSEFNWDHAARQLEALYRRVRDGKQARGAPTLVP